MSPETHPWPLPPSETTRLAEVQELEMLDTPAEEPFDGIVEVTAALFNAPFAVLGLVDGSRHWFKAKVGTNLCETSRSIAFCRFTILSQETMVVENLAHDPRFHDHPLVVGFPQVRSYAGAPLVSERGECVGTLCVLDVAPRTFDSSHRRLLERLARQAMDAFETRRLIRLLAEGRVPS